MLILMLNPVVISMYFSYNALIYLFIIYFPILTTLRIVVQPFGGTRSIWGNSRILRMKLDPLWRSTLPWIP